MRETLLDYCVEHDRGELLAQWHVSKNGDLTPAQVSYGSKKRIWWRCDRGHEWQSPPYARTEKGSRCPYCTGKLTAPGMDFAVLYPEAAAQWHPEKNGKAKPSQFLPGSHKSVWWRCGHGHEWKATIKSRVEGRNCPVCAGKTVLEGENDLRTVAPLLADQWHPTRNGDLKPTQVTSGSRRKVWWRCKRGHEWQAAIHSRSAGVGCPVCSGKVIVPGVNDLESYDPELAKQWCQEKNGRLHPSRISAYSNRLVWWRCRLNHEWKSTVYSRTFSRSGCPYCANRKVLAGFNDLKTVVPLVAAQWHQTKNEPLEPSMVLPGSTKRVWWKCSDGHEWKAVIYSRTGAQKCGCPVCAGRAPRKYD